jgi:tetratricopeptide (TPR) repeat protein
MSETGVHLAIDESQAALDEAIRLSRERGLELLRSYQLMVAGGNLLQAQEFTPAEDAFSAALGICAGHNSLSQILRALGRRDDAINHAHLALRISAERRIAAEHGESLNTLGEALLSASNVTAAEGRSTPRSSRPLQVGSLGTWHGPGRAEPT